MAKRDDNEMGEVKFEGVDFQSERKALIGLILKIKNNRILRGKYRGTIMCFASLWGAGETHKLLKKYMVHK